MSRSTEYSGHEFRIEAWLGITADSKPKVYEGIFASTQVASLSYWLGIFFSAGIATFGLVESSPAVIIGAMLISPLMGPLMAAGLALAAGDLYPGLEAVLNLVASITASIAFFGFLVWLLPFHSETAEIVSRINPNLLDLGIALLSGLAGSIIVCRGGGAGATVLPGVAIAVALMPPLCVMGFGFGSGLDLEIIGGAGLLFLTNLVAIVASAFLVFLLVRMSGPEVQEAMAASRAGKRFGIIPSRSSAGRILAAGAQLRWRVLMILFLLGSLAVPGSQRSVRKGVVQGDLKRLVASKSVVSQQVSVGRDLIAIRLISTARIPDLRVEEVRRDLMRRTGRDVDLTVNTVASGSELAELMAHIASPAPAVPKPHGVSGVQKDLLDKVGAAIADIRPSSDAPIQDFDVVSGAGATTIDVRYQAPADLGAVPIHMVLQSLRTDLGMPDLNLNTERIPAPLPQKPAGQTK